MFSCKFVRIFAIQPIICPEILGTVYLSTFALSFEHTHPEYADEFEIATAPDFNVTAIFLLSLRPIACILSTPAGENITVSSSVALVSVQPGRNFNGIICN